MVCCRDCKFAKNVYLLVGQAQVVVQSQLTALPTMVDHVLCAILMGGGSLEDINPRGGSRDKYLD
jgi:hypothetical protein